MERETDPSQTLSHKEKKPPIPQISFSKLVRPLWDAVGSNQKDIDVIDQSLKDVAEIRSRVLQSEVAHLWLPACWLLTQYPLAFYGNTNSENENFLERFYPSQKGKRQAVARMLRRAHENVTNPVGQNTIDFVESNRLYDRLWDQAMVEFGGDLQQYSLTNQLPLAEATALRQKLADKKWQAQKHPGNLFGFLHDEQIFPPGSSMVFERSIRLEINTGEMWAAIFCQPDMVVINPDGRVLVFDIKLGSWHNNIPWNFTIHFFDIIAQLLLEQLLLDLLSRRLYQLCNH